MDPCDLRLCRMGTRTDWMLRLHCAPLVAYIRNKNNDRSRLSRVTILHSPLAQVDALRTGRLGRRETRESKALSRAASIIYFILFFFSRGGFESSRVISQLTNWMLTYYFAWRSGRTMDKRQRPSNPCRQSLRIQRPKEGLSTAHDGRSLSYEEQSVVIPEE